MPSPARNTGTATTRDPIRKTEASLQGRLHRGLGQGEVARGFRGEEQAHAPGQPPELVAGRGAVAQPRQGIFDDGMTDDVQRHRRGRLTRTMAVSRSEDASSGSRMSERHG
jgi:hypothetical protein